MGDRTFSDGHPETGFLRQSLQLPSKLTKETRFLLPQPRKPGTQKTGHPETGFLRQSLQLPPKLTKETRFLLPNTFAKIIESDRRTRQCPFGEGILHIAPTSCHSFA